MLKAQDIIKKFYASSQTPTAVITREDIWLNTYFKKVFVHLSEDKRKEFLLSAINQSGIINMTLDEKFYTVNVIKSLGLSIVEVIRAESISTILKSPSVREYIKYIFQKMRYALSSVSTAADEIYAVISSYNGESDAEIIIQQLNNIDRELMSAISSFLSPEQLFYLMNDNCEVSTVCLRSEIDNVITDSLDIFPIPCENISIDFKSTYYAIINRQTFKVILSYMIAKCFENEYLPTNISVSDEGTDKHFTSIKVSAVYGNEKSNCRKNNQSDIFFDYVCDTFCNKYNAAYTVRNAETYAEFILTFPVTIPNYLEIKAPNKFQRAGRHFSTLNIKITDLYGSNRYILGNDKHAISTRNMKL